MSQQNIISAIKSLRADIKKRYEEINEKMDKALEELREKQNNNKRRGELLERRTIL